MVVSRSTSSVTSSVGGFRRAELSALRKLIEAENRDEDEEDED